MAGWIKIHRKILDHWLYNEYRPLTKREAWENMLLWANFKNEKVLIKGQLIDCNRGQILFSLETYAAKFVWTVGQVRNFFELLKKDNMIKVEGLKYTTRLTICNYDSYQDLQQTDDILTTFSQQTDDILTTFSQQQDKKEKKYKNDKNDKNDIGEKKFFPPTHIEIENYFVELGVKSQSKFEAEKFFDFYSSKNWFVGKNKMKDWKAACRNWKKGIKQTDTGNKIAFPMYEPSKTIQDDPDRLNF